MPPRGTLNLALSVNGAYAATGHVESCPDINGAGCAAMRVPDEWHSLKLVFGELRLHAEYGITRWLAADLLWSLRVVHIGFRLEDAATRTPISPPFGADLHHRTETLVGLTDPWLSLRAAKRVGSWAFVFRVGVTLPVGSTVADPFSLGREGKPHEHIQFGSGTVDPLVGIEVGRSVGRFSVTGWMLGKASLYQNTHHSQAGSQLLGGLDVGSDLWTPRGWFVLGALVHNEQPEHWNGVTETEGNLGRTDLLLDTSISWRFRSRWSVTLGAKFPLWSQAVGAQLNTPAVGELTISRPFDLTGRR